jgi:hypothetical protein
MLGRRSIYALVAAAVAGMTVAAPGVAREGAPDPAIAQYVETMPTSGGAKAGDEARSEQKSAENSQPAAGDTSSAELIGLGGALFVLSAGAVGFVAVRARRNGT